MLGQTNTIITGIRAITMRGRTAEDSKSGIICLFTLILSCLGLLLYSAQELASTARYSNVAILGASIAQGRTVSQQTLDRYASHLDAIIREQQCRSDILQSGMLMSLARVDGLSEMQEYDAWLQALRSAETYLKFALRCQPADSAFWMHYAAIRSLVSENPQEIAALMHRARLLAPADNNMLLERLLLWDSVTEATLQAANEDVEADLRAVLTYGDRCEAGALLRAAHGPLRRRVDAVSLTLPVERIERFTSPCSPKGNTIRGPFR